MGDEDQPFDDLEAAERGQMAFSDDESAPIRRSSRREKKNDKKAAIATYKAGRDALLGKNEFEDIYEEVDENEYRSRVQQRLEEDEFIVDDGSGDFDGYRDHGGEIWDEDDTLDGESAAAKKAKKKQLGGPSMAKKKKAAAPKRRVNSLFTGGGKASRLGASVIKMGEDAAATGEDAFLAEVMAEAGPVEEEESDLDLHRDRKKKKSLAHLALFGSNTDARQAFLEETMRADSPPPQRQEKRREPAYTSPPSHGARRSAGNAEPVRMDLGRYSPPPEDDDYSPPSPQARGESPKPRSSSPGRTAAVAATSASASATATVHKSPVKPAHGKLKVLNMPVEEEDEEEDEDGGKTSHLVSSTEKRLESSEDWQRVRQESKTVTQLPEVQIDTQKLPLEDADGEQVLNFFWLDAYEGEGARSDTIYLFGKVWVPEASTFVSCCVTVANLEKNIFVLPREYKVDGAGDVTDEKVDMAAVFEEVSEVLNKAGIDRFRTKPVTRKYAFELADVPAETTYLKIKYSAAKPSLPGDTSGKTFSHIFGTNIGALERFIMKRDLMGPCWLQIKNARPAKKSYSWCQLEAEIDNPKFVVKAEAQRASPPVVVLSLAMQTILNRKTHANEILCISGLVHNAVEMDGATKNPEKGFSHFTVIRKLGDNPFPFDLQATVQRSKRSVECIASERALLGFFMAKIAKIDPDVIVGHNIMGFDLDVLMHRIKELNVPHWSRLGRLRRSNMPNLKGGIGNRSNLFHERQVMSGRLLCDVQISAREFIRQVAYKLSDLASTQLSVKRTDIDQDVLPQMYSNTDNILKLTDYVERDAFLIMSLMFKLEVLPLSKQIANITGGLLARVFAGGRAERNEYLLCHEFHKLKFIVPDKMTWLQKNKGKEQPKEVEEDEDEDGAAPAAPAPGGGKSKRRKPAYSGGLVLEPKRGFYDKYILLLDFNSLYPSIIQEYNLCFTTVSRATQPPGAPDAGEEGVIPNVPDASLPRGVLPRVLKTLIEKRAMVKSLIKKEKDLVKLTEYDIRQKALKLTANSMYGCLGFTGSRFYAKPIAALITSKGREILQKTVDLAQETLNLEVIYGDTDSIMINTRSTDLAEVKKMGSEVKKQVNALFKELVIDIDSIFKTMLLLKKKKYAALAIVEKDGEISTSRETKGLDVVRRDWCALSHDVGNYILSQVLSHEQRESLVTDCHEYLRRVAEDVNTPGKVPLEKFVIHKGLTKNPEEYADKQHQPHVQVALRMKATGKNVRALDTIPYVICLDGTTNAATQRAYHPDDVRKNMALKLDVEYYLKNQIHPVVSRLMEPIEGTDNAQIAECLGLDPGSFRKEYQVHDNVEEVGMALSTQMSDEERFKSVEKWQVKCQACGESSDFEGVFRMQGETRRCGLLCPNASCSAVFNATYLSNMLTLAMRSHIDTYYLGLLTCDEPSCIRASQETRQLSVKGRDCLEPNCKGKMHAVYNDKQLYTQILYFSILFDVEHAIEQLEEDERVSAKSLVVGHEATFSAVHKHVEKYLNKSARRHVQLGQLFSIIFAKKETKAR